VISETTIPVPFSRRLQLAIRRYVPVLTLCVAGTAAMWMWRGEGQIPNAIGEVDGTEIAIASPMGERIVALPHRLKVYDAVHEGDVVAKLDDRQPRAALATLRAELSEMETELQLAQARAAVHASHGSGRVPGISRRTNPDGLHLINLESKIDPSHGSSEQGDSLAPLDAAPSRLRAAIAVHKAKIDELQTQIDALELKAPADGTVIAIHVRPGQVVQPGEPILSIVAANSHHITVYVRQNQNIEPAIGMPVNLRRRLSQQPLVRSAVERIGPRLESVPTKLLRDPKIPEWGTPVRITLPPEFDGRLGELVDVTFCDR
jgi:multidrug resistance efflux pump